MEDCATVRSATCRHREASARIRFTTIAARSRTASAKGNREGSILLIVLVTVAILALSVLSFSSLMLVEERAARVMTRQIQSKHLVDSGMEYTRLFLSRPDNEIFEAGRLWNNEDSFRGVPAVADVNNAGRRSEIGRFTLVAPNMSDDGIVEGVRYGVVDESSKINVNVLPFYDSYGEAALGDALVARNLLLALPNMTEEIADAIVDFVDSDDEQKEFGAESGYYNGLTPAYNAKNGPLDSLDELLLVRGVTAELLFGLDTNRNGVLDESEAALGDVSSTDSESVLGWANYLTLYSKESNLTAAGLRRININADDLDQLYDDLKSTFDDDWANFVLMYRLGFERVTEVDETLALVGASQVPFEVPEGAESTVENKFQSVLDLMDVSFTGVNADGESVVVQSPVQSLPPGNGSLYAALQSMTVYEGDSVPGRINIRQAPRVILEGLPIFRDDPELVEQYIANRELDLDDPQLTDLPRTFETHLMEEGLSLIHI